MDRAGQMIFIKFTFLANVNEQELVAAVQSFLDLVDVGLADAASGIVDDLEEAGRMLMCHKSSFPNHAQPRRCNRGRRIALMVPSHGRLCACSAASPSISMNRCLSREKSGESAWLAYFRSWVTARA